MKLRRRRASEVPPKIKSFINGVIAAPLESIEEPLKSFFWDFDKGDFHHWLELFNHFDTFFEKYIKPRKDLQVEDDFLVSDPPFPREAVLQILRVVRIILDNCTNKHFYSSYEVGDEVLLKSILNSTETVARGWVKSLDPNEQVGGKEIGREWCEVNVQVAIKRDEYLVRPYGLFITIEDAIGASITWPCPFISVVRED